METPFQSPLDLAWAHLHVDSVVPPLGAEPSPEQWEAAFATRDKLCELLLSPLRPHMKWEGTASGFADMLDLARRALVQSADQKNRLGSQGLPASASLRNTYLNTFLGDARAQRPFCLVGRRLKSNEKPSWELTPRAPSLQLMRNLHVNIMLHKYIESTKGRMVSFPSRSSLALDFVRVVPLFCPPTSG